MIKLEMPHNSGHRRSRSGSYFSGFTRAVAHLQGQAIRQARSSEKLNEQLTGLQPSHRALSVWELSQESQEWKTFQACKTRIEQELDLQVQSLLSEKQKLYKEVTVPNSVKYSVSREPPATVMARPRSPTSKDTEFLDQTLLSIRKKLNALSTDRLEMESKMEELMSGIKTIHAQHQSKRCLPPQTDLYSSIRRVRSSATSAKRPSNLSITSTSSCTKEKTPEHLSLSQEIEISDLSQDSTLSASSQTSPSSTRQRSASAAASIRFRPSKPSPISLSSALSCGNVEGDSWMPATPIHELPESPTYVSPVSLSNSSSSIHCYSIHGTMPRNEYRRSASVSSSPSSATKTTHRSPMMLTSTPNITKTQEKELYHTLPTIHHRNAVSEGVINSSIPEDEVDNGSVTDSLSQVSSCTDEGSPRSGGSTIITRRSSLTGQIEHYRKPRLLKKQNSDVVAKKRLTKQNSDVVVKTTLQPTEVILRQKDHLSASQPSDGFKVLNKGRRSKRYSRTSIILPSIETTV